MSFNYLNFRVKKKHLDLESPEYFQVISSLITLALDNLVFFLSFVIFCVRYLCESEASLMVGGDE